MSPHQAVAAKRDTPCLQSRLPAVPSPDRRRFVQQAVLLFLSSQPRELFSQRAIGRQERFFAVQNRRVVTIEIIPAVEFQRPQVELHAPHERREREN